MSDDTEPLNVTIPSHHVVAHVIRRVREAAGMGPPNDVFDALEELYDNLRRMRARSDEVDALRRQVVALHVQFSPKGGDDER